MQLTLTMVYVWRKRAPSFACDQ